MTSNSGTSAQDWRWLFNLSLEGMQERLDYLCDPARLQKRPQYRKRPAEGWLTAFIRSLRLARHALKLGGRAGEATQQDTARLDEIVEAAKACTDQHLQWVREQLRRELEEMVHAYDSATWVELVAGGLPHEFWYVLSRRSMIEAHLRAPELLHPAVRPDPILVQRVERADGILREAAPRLWRIDPPAGGEDERRELFQPRDDWWWWLDQPVRPAG